MDKAYVHGYDDREIRRLQDQANTLVELLHSDTSYKAGSRVLEAGCGVGAQTVTLARNSPQASFISIDISGDSISEARRAVEYSGFSNVQFQRADIFNLNFEPESFDHVFVCHVLEHLSRPDKALAILKSLIKVGGTIIVIEGIRGTAIKAGIVDQVIFDKGIQDLYRTTEADGVFCYTFFKAFAAKK